MGRETARAQEAARAEQLKRQAIVTTLVTTLKKMRGEKRRPYMQCLLSRRWSVRQGQCLCHVMPSNHLTLPTAGLTDEGPHFCCMQLVSVRAC